MHNEFAAVIYDRMNIIVRVEERLSAAAAWRAGNFWTKFGGWFKVVEGREEIDMYKAMINF